MKGFIIITELPANHCPHLFSSYRAVRLFCPRAQAVWQQKPLLLQSQQERHSGRQTEELRTLQGNGSTSSTVCWARRVNRHCPSGNGRYSKGKTQSYSTARGTAAGMHGRPAFHLPEDCCRLPSQQEVVQSTPMVMTEEALPCAQEERGCFLGRRCCSHGHQKLVITQRPPHWSCARSPARPACTVLHSWAGGTHSLQGQQENR